MGPLDKRLAPLCAALGLLALPASAAAADPRCAPAKHPGGDWKAYGHDDRNTRSQPKEDEIGAGNVRDLEPAWTFNVEEHGADGDIAGTPVVRFGCVYVATAGDGHVWALNADTGKVVWKKDVPDGWVYGSVGVTRKRVYVGVQRTLQGLTGCPRDGPCLGPFMVSLRRSDGKRVWASKPIDKQRGSETYATPVIVGGVVMIGVSGGIAELTPDEEVRHEFQGSMVFLEAKTGKILHKTWSIHKPEVPDDEYAGGGIWGTPAVDRKRRLAWVGTANPYVPSAAHPRAGAILKIDIDRRSKTFGKILAFGEGTPEEYLDAFTALPCLDFPGNVPPYPTGLGSCFDLDLDFGASPNLFRGGDGKLMVGAGQKSGHYHVFDADSMVHKRATVLGPPSYFGGIVGSTAYDGSSVFGPITIPGYLWSIDANRGNLRWAYPLADVLHWGPPVAVANGIVYSLDYFGYLNALDADSGLPLAKLPLELEEGGDTEGSWGGVSVARHKIYAAIGTGSPGTGGVIAFSLP